MARPPPNTAKTYTLKLGKSFDKRPEIIYNTMRFDFKPVSLGSSKDLTMEIGGENGLQVTATMAGKHGSGGGQGQSAQTVYKGSKKPYSTKECVLIVDDVTGEVTLERLGDNVQLKKARPEGGSSRSNGNRGNPSSNSGNSPNLSDKFDSSPSSNAEYSPAPSASPLPSPSLPEIPKQQKAPATGRSQGPSVPSSQPSSSKSSPIKPIPSQTQPPSRPTPYSKEPEKSQPPPKPVHEPVRRMSSSSSSSSSSSGSSSSSSDSEPDEPAQQNIDDILMDIDLPATQPPPKSSSGGFSQKAPVIPPARSINELVQDDLRLTDDSDDEDDNDPLHF